MAEDSPWPEWFGLSDRAKADQATRLFTDAAFDHRAACEVCQRKEPCDTLRVMIDEVEVTVRNIGDQAWASWTALQEERHGLIF